MCKYFFYIFYIIMHSPTVYDLDRADAIELQQIKKDVIQFSEQLQFHYKL